MNKQWLYILGISAIIVGFSWMLAGGSSFQENVAPTGVIEEVTLGLKDLNYYPNTVKVTAGNTVRIYLDESVIGCLRDFTIRDFNVHEYLRTPEDYVEFVADKKGRHSFACSMGMGTGVLIVE